MTKASEGIFDDSVVYVTRQGSQVGVDGGRITVYMKGEGEPASFPMGQVDTINIFGNVNFTTPFVASANEHGIVLNYFTQNGRYRGSFVPEKNTIAEVRRRQYALSERESLRIARHMVRGKIRNSRTLLNRKDVPDNGRLAELEDLAEKACDLDELRGIEGEAGGDLLRPAQRLPGRWLDIRAAHAQAAGGPHQRPPLTHLQHDEERGSERSTPVQP